MKRSTSWKHLVEAYQVCNQKYAKLLTDFNLTTSQLDVLIQIETLGELATPKSIAKGLLVTKGNVTSVTKRLIERNLITQKPNSQDKRSAIYCLTNAGNSLLQKAKLAAKLFIDVQLSPFSDEEVKIVGDLMLRMRTHLESECFDNELNAIQESVFAEEKY